MGENLKAFFDTEERIEALLEETRSWVGTPFRKYNMAKGHGVDCVRLVAKVLENVGAIPVVDWNQFPRYTMDWSSHHDDPILEKAIAYLDLKYIRIEHGEPLRIGDVLAFVPGKVVYHLGIFVGDGQFLHTIDQAGTEIVGMGNRTFQRFFEKGYAMRPGEIV